MIEREKDVDVQKKQPPTTQVDAARHAAVSVKASRL